MSDEPKLAIVPTIPRATNLIVRRISSFIAVGMLAPLVAVVGVMLLITAIVALTLFCALAPFMSAFNPEWIKNLTND